MRLKKGQGNYGVPMIIIAMLILFVVYVLMVYPEERARMLNKKEVTIGGNTIYINENGFEPEKITIQKGETITWVNHDVKGHRLNFGDFKSKLISPSESYSHTFTEKGIFVYSDEFSPEFVGKVIVN
jgi:plastocyanin